MTPGKFRKEAASHDSVTRAPSPSNYDERGDRRFHFGTQESGRNTVWIILLGLIVTTMPATLVPDDVLSRFAILDGYANLLGDLIPSINALASVSVFPEVTRLVLACAWTCAPVQTLLLLLSGSAVFDLGYLRRRRFFYAFLLSVALIVVTTLALFQYVDPSDLVGNTLSERVLRSMSTSKLALGLIAGCAAITIAGTLCLLIVWLKLFPKIYLDVKEKDSL